MEADQQGTADGPIRLRPLSIVEEGDDVLVGDPLTGRFISVPAVGGVVIRALQRGADLAGAAAEARAATGRPVDVRAFVEALGRLGFVDTGEPDAAPLPPPRTAAVQQRRWVAGVPPRIARRFFSRAAWIGYACALAVDLIILVAVPSLRPAPLNVFFLDSAGVALLVLTPLSYALIGVHEAWHWLAARAAGLSARFGIDRRLYFLVFETDLSQIWSLPRRRRYGPQLAGLAIDGVSLAVLLTAQLLDRQPWWPLPHVLARAAGALTFGIATAMVWQCMVFLRTDLYGVLVTATGCRDLWKVKSLLLRRAVRRLTPDQADALRRAHPRDLAVGRWFRWVHLAGLGLAAAYFAAVFLPILVRLVRWTVDGLRPGPAHGTFWITAAVSTLLIIPRLAPLAWWTAGRLTPPRRDHAHLP